MRYPVIIVWSQEDEAYVAKAPDLRGCAAHGETPDQALRELRTAMQGWLQAARELGKPIPKPSAGKGAAVNPIRIYRELSEMTQPELARATGINQRVISRLERGERQPTLDHLVALSKALRIPADRLYPKLSFSNPSWRAGPAGRKRSARRTGAADKKR